MGLQNYVDNVMVAEARAVNAAAVAFCVPAIDICFTSDNSLPGIVALGNFRGNEMSHISHNP